MSCICENRYIICRELAGLTQEEAAEAISISVRSLSDYENGHTVLSDELVDRMAEIYLAPMVGYEHVRDTNVLGKYPPSSMPETNGDMAFQLVISHDKLNCVVESVKKSFPMVRLTTPNGRITHPISTLLRASQGNFFQPLLLLGNISKKKAHSAKRRRQLDITGIRVRRTFPDDKIKATISVTIGGDFTIHDIKVIDGAEQQFVAMPWPPAHSTYRAGFSKHWMLKQLFPIPMF